MATGSAAATGSAGTAPFPLERRRTGAVGARRFAFTVAHEVGHWQLHRPIIEMDKVRSPIHPRER